jgi:hypothetical protein
MTVDIETIMKLKNRIDNETHEAFSKMMKYVDKKFISLSSSNIYKRVQKVQFIKTPKNSNNIIHILNKLTADNYQQIKTKIFMKNTSDNTEEFIVQIIKYSIQSQINSKHLLAICNDLLHIHSDDIKLHDFARKTFFEYFEQYLQCFNEFESLDTTNYESFVNKNEQSAQQLNRCNFIVLALTNSETSQNNIFHDDVHNLVNLLRILIYKALECMPLTEPYENKLSVIFDSIKKVISHCACSKLEKEFKEMAILFRNDFAKDLTKVLNNKLRFKVLDIMDIINKQC